MEFLYSVVESFNDLTKKEIRKLSIINGLFWAVVWIVLAFLFWNGMIVFTRFMIGILPFKFVQNAGAEFVFMILWLQAVLITIGIFFTFFNNLLSKKTLTISVSFVIAIVWLILFFYFREEILGYLEKLIRIFPFETVEEAVSNVLAFFIFYSLYIISMYFGFLLFSEKAVLNLIKEEYPYIEIKGSFSKIKIVSVILKDFVAFLVFLFITYPLLFVPCLNIVLIVSLWAFMIKNALFETVFSIIGDNIRIDNKLKWGFSIFSVFLNFIPLVNIFAPALGVLSVYHYIMEKKSDLLAKG